MLGRPHSRTKRFSMPVEKSLDLNQTFLEPVLDFAKMKPNPRQCPRNNSGSLAIFAPIHSKGVSKPYKLSISPTATLSIPITMYFAKWAHAFAMYLEVNRREL